MSLSFNKNFITINDKKIGESYPPYIVAEVSANHNQNINIAYRLIEEAKSAGADAIKLQTYKPETITLDSCREEFIIKKGIWSGRRLYDLYEEAHTPWEWHQKLFNHAKEVGITIFSTPFDETAVDFLEKLGAPAYKIASFEIVDLGLIKYIARTRKPIIISTGMANLAEIEAALNAAVLGGCREIVLLRCVSGYPAKSENYNLKTIPDIRQRFDVLTGLSDHTLDNVTAITSVAMGACIIEKHFTLDRAGGGPDDSFSIEPNELASLCNDARSAWAAMGSIDYKVQSCEKENLKFRRSLYFVKDLTKGEIITKDSIRSVRPANGISPYFLNDIIGKRANRDILKNSPVSKEDYE